VFFQGDRPRRVGHTVRGVPRANVHLVDASLQPHIPSQLLFSIDGRDWKALSPVQPVRRHSTRAGNGDSVNWSV